MRCTDGHPNPPWPQVRCGMDQPMRTAAARRRDPHRRVAHRAVHQVARRRLPQGDRRRPDRQGVAARPAEVHRRWRAATRDHASISSHVRELALCDGDAADLMMRRQEPCVTGDCYARFCESRGVKFPLATRQFVDEHRDTFPLKWLCRIVEVSVSVSTGGEPRRRFRT